MECPHPKDALLKFLFLSNCIFVFQTYAAYDVTRRETFTNLSEIWAKEIDLYSTNPECVKMLVGNKVDKVSFIDFFIFYQQRLIVNFC